MATSEQPDLNKAPPHLEGDLLKQRNSAVLKKGWKKYFFIVIEDHLKYYKKKEDYESGKEPISLMRLSQVKDITEAVFHAVPKKHHLNCGFSLVAFHEKTQQEQTFHLLAETSDVRRYWVHGLRYIKSYWSKKKIRETILSEEKERELLERILQEDDDDMEVLPSKYWEDSLQDGEDVTNKSVSLTIHFGNISKVSTKVLPLDTTSDLLESIKEQLTSSATQLWLVDQLGITTILDSQHHPAAYQVKAHRFYAIDPSQRVLVLFYGDGEFESIAVSSKATAEDIINDTELQIQLDKAGINNSGLFLKTEYDESLFGPLECPSDVLFTLDGNGRVSHLNTGQLVVKNKALHGGRRTQKAYRTASRITRTTSSERRELEEMSEEEDAQLRALNQLLQKKRVLQEHPATHRKTSGHPATVYDDDWVVMPSPKDRHASESVPTQRARSSAITSDSTVSPQNRRKRIASAVPSVNSSPRHSSPRSSPTISPSRETRGHAHQCRQLPEAPDRGQRSVIQRRNATRKYGSSPVISIDGEIAVDQPSLTPGNHLSPLSRSRSPTIRRELEKEGSEGNDVLVDALVNGESSAAVTPFQSINSHLRTTTYDEEDRLDKLFDRTQQLEREEREMSERETDDSLKRKMAALSQGEDGEGGEEEEGEEEEEGKTGEASIVEDIGLKPMVIDVSTLVNRTSPSHLPHTTTLNETIPQQTTAVNGKPIPMEVRSPNILKIAMLASETRATETQERPMDLLSLSGVVLKNDRGVWRIVEGSNFHDPLPFDCTDHTENFVLPGGIRVIFNHSRNPKRWHVLPPPTPTHSVDSRSDADSTEHAQNIVVEDMDSSATPHMHISPHHYRKAIVTEIGAASLDVVRHFEKTRDLEEKKRIGCDMINTSMGYTVRGRFCSALASLILEGLRPYRIQHLVLNDIWKVTSSFCQEVQFSDASLFMPQELEKLVQITQAIGSVRELRDHNMKFRTFLCLCLSRGLLCKWLQSLPGLNDTLTKYYQPWAFLVQASDQGANQRLYSNMLQDLEPLNFLPFDLSIDFENRQERLAVSNDARNHSRIPTPSSSPRPSPNPSPPRTSPTQSPLNSPKFSSSSATPPRRLSVTVVKNAATGQRTNNVISAVWQPPENDVNEEGRDEFGDKEAQFGMENGHEVMYGGALIEEPDFVTTGVTTELYRAERRGGEEGEGGGEGEREGIAEAKRGDTEWVRRRERECLEREREMERRNGGESGGLGKATSWLRKLATNLQNRNIVGDATKPPSPAHPAKRYVQALYANVAEDRDELSFSKGDVMSVTGQINDDWLICAFGQRAGIVPANFVQEVII